MEEHREIVDEVKQGAGDIKAQLTHAAHEATDAIATEANAQAKAAIGTVAQESKVLASALEGAAEQAEREGARLVQEPLRRIAAFCQRIADKTESDGPRQLFAELEDFGRREPVLLFGAAALAGFLGTRALRAGAAAQPNASHGGEPAESSARLDTGRA